MDFDNMWKSMGANVNTPGPVEQATRGDFRISGTTITKYIGKKVKLRLPDGITTIGEDAFAINDNIDTVVIPEGVTRIESGGFATNRSLVKVEFPTSLKYIGPGAFMYCSLREVNLPEGLEEIDDQAFMNCRNIKGLKVPESVVRIGDYAFSNMGLPLMSEPGTPGATVLLHENLRGIIDEESVAGPTNIIFKYYGVKNKDLSKFQNKGNDNYEEEYQVSELSGQAVSIAGGKYDHDFDDIIPEGVVFKLPNGYKIEKFTNEEGDDGLFIGGNYTYNDEGEPSPAFQCNFVNVNVANREEAIKAGKISAAFEPGVILDVVVKATIDEISENAPVNKEIKISRDYPATTAINIYKPISIFGRTIHSYLLMVLFEIGEDSCFGFNTSYIYSEDGNDEFFNNFYKILKSISINNEQISLPSNAKALAKAIHFDADEDTETIEIPINFNLKFGDEETSYTYNGDGSVTSTRVNTSLGFAYPDSSLTPHMDQIGMAGGLGFLPGIKVMVNETGTEYEFQQLDEYSYLDHSADNYKLADAADIISEVFRVDASVFDEKHDRESEIKEGYLHRAYMMSALRSFAWTLAKYCDDLECSPANLNIEQINKIVDAVAGANWKNYDGDSYCKGLCGTADLHVFYMPENTPTSIITSLLPSSSELSEVEERKKTFPTYNPILSTIGSLDELRRDLLYIYPAIRTLYESILENRDHSVPLDSSDGDILYAWCALARAARGPFFSEDGPMNCWYTRKTYNSYQSLDDLDIETENNVFHIAEENVCINEDTGTFKTTKEERRNDAEMETSDSHVIVNESNIDKMMQYVKDNLDTNMWAVAIRTCEGILDYDPSNAETYLLKMLAECKCKSEDALVISAEDFWENKNYKFINRFGDQELIDRLNGYREQCELVRAKRRFRYALGLLEKGDEKNLAEASEMFEELGALLCAADLRKECEYKIAKLLMEKDDRDDLLIMEYLERADDYADAKEIIDEISNAIAEREKAKEQKKLDDKKNLYNEATEQIKEGTVESLRQAIVKLEMLLNKDESFMDCDQLLESTKKLLDEKIEERDNETKGKTYSEAVEIMKRGDFNSLLEAISKFATIGGYKDVDKLKQKCIDKKNALVEEQANIDRQKRYYEGIELLRTATIDSLESATIIFHDLGEYSDAQEKAEACWNLREKLVERSKSAYDKAQTLMASYSNLVAKRGRFHSEKFEDQMACLRDMNSAINILEVLGNYEDAASKLAKCKLQREEIRNLVGKKQYTRLYEKYNIIPSLEKVEGNNWIEWKNQLDELRAEFTEIDFLEDARRKIDEIDDKETQLLKTIESRVNADRVNGSEIGAWVLLRKHYVYQSTLKAFEDWGNATQILAKCEENIEALTNEIDEVCALSGIGIKDMGTEKKAYNAIYHDATKLFKKSSKQGKESAEDILKAAEAFKAIKYWNNAEECYRTCMDKYSALQTTRKEASK